MRLIDADALKEEVNKKNVVGRFNTLLLIDNAPTVKTYCYFCGQTEHGQVVPDTVKVEVTEVHTFAKPDDVSDIKFGD